MRTVTRLFHVSLRKFDLFELDVGLPFVHCHSNHCTKGSTWWSISGRPCGVAPAAAFFSGITPAFWNLSTYIEGTESSLTSLTGNTRWSAWRFNMIQPVMCDKNCSCCVAEVCCDQRAHLDNWPVHPPWPSPITHQHAMTWTRNGTWFWSNWLETPPLSVQTRVFALVSQYCFFCQLVS